VFPCLGLRQASPLLVLGRHSVPSLPGSGSILPNSASCFLLRTILEPETSGASAQKFVLGLGCLVPASIRRKLGCFWMLRLRGWRRRMGWRWGGRGISSRSACGSSRSTMTRCASRSLRPSCGVASIMVSSCLILILLLILFSRSCQSSMVGYQNL
jgi:hypothetical protein